MIGISQCLCSVVAFVVVLASFALHRYDAFHIMVPVVSRVVRSSSRITRYTIARTNSSPAASSSSTTTTDSASITPSLLVGDTDSIDLDSSSWILHKVDDEEATTATTPQGQDDVEVLHVLPTTTTTKKKLSFPVILWRFSRPHTIIGSALAIPAIHILAAPSISMIWSKCMLTSILYATIPSLLMNIFITGLNQITDVDIDKINKPSLVIASGDLSTKHATYIVITCLLLSLLMGGRTNGLAFSLWGSAILGTMYSLPPFRLKRFPLLAAISIVAVRGTIINAGFFAYASATAFGATSTNMYTTTAYNCLISNTKCMLSSLYFGIFGIVIALMKDVPDLKGDQMSNIRTFTVRVGQKKIFHAMRRLLFTLFLCTSIGFAYGSITAATATAANNNTRLLALCRGTISILALWTGITARQKGLKVNAEDGNEVYSYYMSLWNLFYQSYLVLPFARKHTIVRLI